MNFSKNLRYYRQEAGYSARELSFIIGVPYITYHRYEHGVWPTKGEILVAITEALNIPMDWLFSSIT